MRTIFLSILLTAGLFAQQSNPKPNSSPAPTASTPEKKQLTSEHQARMKAVDKLEDRLQVKLQELVQLIQSVTAEQRNEVWVAACQSAGWLTAKANECQVDPASLTITHVPAADSSKPETKPDAAK